MSRPLPTPPTAASSFLWGRPLLPLPLLLVVHQQPLLVVRASPRALPFVPRQYVLVPLPVIVHESINCSKILQTIFFPCLLGIRKEANEELNKMGWSADLVRNASKRKVREENDRRSRHVAGSSLGGDKEGSWSVNPSPPRRARRDPPEGYEDAVIERKKETENMDVDPLIDVCAKQGEDDVKMEDEDEEKLGNKLLADPVDVKMETTEAVDTSASKESGHNPYSRGGDDVADSRWSSRRDEDIDNSGSRRRDPRAPRSKPLDWGRSSTRDEDRSESGRRRDNSHWNPPRSGRDDRSHRPDVEDRDSKYSSGSRRDDRDKDSRYRDSERSYHPRDDKYSSRADRTDRDRDRERDRDRDSRDNRGSRRTKDRSPETERRRERERDTRRAQKDDDREKERGPRDPKDRDAGSTRQDKDEATTGRDEEIKNEVPTTNAACLDGPKDDMDKEIMRESKEETCAQSANMDVDPSTTRSDGGGWFVESTHLDRGSLPTDEPKASSDTKRAEERHRQSSHRSESRAGHDRWGRDNSRSTRGGDDHQSSRRRDDDLKSRSRRERDSGTRSERDRGSGKRNDHWQDREKDRATWNGKDKEKDMRSRDNRDKKDKPGTWGMRETEKGIWDGEFDDRDRRTKHESVLPIDGESEGVWQTGSKREASPFLSKWPDSLGRTALSPPSTEAQGDIRKGEESSTTWGPDTNTGWPDPGDQANTAGSSGWSMPGDNGNTSNAGKQGLAATDPDYGKWTVSKPKADSDASQGYLPTYRGYSSRKNDKDRKPDWSERSRDSGRGRPSRGRPTDNWVPPKTRDSGWASRKKENDKWKSDSSQVQWTGPVETLDPAGDWAGLFTTTDSQPQWTGPVECVNPAGDWAGVFSSTDSQRQETVGSMDSNTEGAELKDSQSQWTGPVERHDPAGDWGGVSTTTDSQPQPQWTGSIVDPASDWASAELQIQEDGESEPYEYIPWVPGVRGGGRGRSGRGRIRGPRVRKKKVRTIGLMRGFQDDSKEEEDEDDKPEGATEAPNSEEPNPFWYLAEGETPEDEAAKWGMPSS